MPYNRELLHMSVVTVQCHSRRELLYMSVVTVQCHSNQDLLHMSVVTVQCHNNRELLHMSVVTIQCHSNRELLHMSVVTVQCHSRRELLHMSVVLPFPPTSLVICEGGSWLGGESSQLLWHLHPPILPSPKQRTYLTHLQCKQLILCLFHSSKNHSLPPLHQVSLPPFPTYILLCPPLPPFSFVNYLDQSLLNSLSFPQSSPNLLLLLPNTSSPPPHLPLFPSLLPHPPHPRYLTPVTSAL